MRNGRMRADLARFVRRAERRSQGCLALSTTSMRRVRRRAAAFVGPLRDVSEPMVRCVRGRGVARMSDVFQRQGSQDSSAAFRSRKGDSGRLRCAVSRTGESKGVSGVLRHRRRADRSGTYSRASTGRYVPYARRFPRRRRSFGRQRRTLLQRTISAHHRRRESDRFRRSNGAGADGLGGRRARSRGDVFSARESRIGLIVNYSLFVCVRPVSGQRTLRDAGKFRRLLGRFESGGLG